MESRWVTPYARGDPGPQQRVADLVAAPGQRHRDEGRRRHPVPGGEDACGPAPPAGSPPAPASPTGIITSRWRGEGTGGVRDLGQLRPVQRPVGDHAEHPARAAAARGPPPGCGAAAGTGRARRRRAGGPGRPRRHRPRGPARRRSRPAAATGAPSASVSTSVRRAGSAGSRPSASAAGTWRVTGTGHGGAVGQPAPPAQRGQVGAGQEAGQRGVRPGQQQLQIGQLTGTRRVRRRVPQHVLGQHPTVAHRYPPLADRHTVSQPTGDRSRAPLHCRPGSGSLEGCVDRMVSEVNPPGPGARHRTIRRIVDTRSRHWSARRGRCRTGWRTPGRPCCP